MEIRLLKLDDQSIFPLKLQLHVISVLIRSGGDRQALAEELPRVVIKQMNQRVKH